jgi:hypothetical protein
MELPRSKVVLKDSRGHDLAGTEPEVAKGADRVRAHTKPEINEGIDRALEQRIRFYATQTRETISERIAELDREWDVERTLQVNASSIILGSFVLGAAVSRKWLLLPVVVSSFLLQHAVQGWCPPLPIFRRRGVRTRSEIEQERCALKVLRGDFDSVLNQKGDAKSPEALAQAVLRGRE